MDNFNCDSCGKEHKVFKAIEAPTPARILDLSAAELKQRVKEIQNSFIIDDRIFLMRGDIFIYAENVTEPFFTWSVWTSIAFEDFKAKAEELQEGKNIEFEGQLESELPFYKTSKGLKVKTVVNINYDYSVVKIDEDSQLRKDQSEKITSDRIIEIMKMFYHNPKGAPKRN